MLKSFFKDLLTYMPAKVLPALTGLITTPILTRLLLPIEYGNWALALGVSDFLFALTCSGIGTAALRFFPVYKVKSELGVFFTNLLLLTGIAVGIASVVGTLAILLFKKALPESLYPLLFISIIMFVANSFFLILSEVLRAQNQSGLFTRFNLINNYFSLGLGLALVIIFNLRVEGLMYGSLIISILLVPFVIRSTMRGVSIGANYLHTSDIHKLWYFAWPLTFGNMAFWGLRLSDRYIIQFFRTGTEVGLYSAVYNISDRTINLLVTLFLLSLGPMVANIYEKHGRELTEQTLNKITRLYLIICLPITTGLSLLASPFIILLTGKEYHEGYRIVGFVAFSTFFWGLSRFACWGLILHNKTRQFALNQTLAATINIVLNLFFVPRYGYAAAAVTTLIGYILLFLLQAYTSRSYLTWKISGRTLLNVMIAVILMGLMVLGINAIDPQDNHIKLTHLSLLILSCSCVYFIALWLLGEINKGEKELIRQFCYKVIRRPL